jgi:hypothetical protein
VTTLLDSTLEVRCLEYRDFHLQATIDPASSHILLEIGRDYGALTMPADLGEQVLRQLRQAGPVVHHPRARRWTFITGPVRPGSLTTSLSAELFRRYVTVASAGSQVVLPSAADERTGYRTWVRSPQAADPVPPPGSVIEALHAVGGRGPSAY